MEVPAGASQNTKRRRARRRRLRRLARLGVLLGLLAVTMAWIVSRVRSRGPHRPRWTAPLLVPYPDPPGIVLHSSMTPGMVHGIPIDAERLEQIHAEDHPQWATTFEGKVYHIGYHYVILPDGTVQ